MSEASKLDSVQHYAIYARIAARYLPKSHLQQAPCAIITGGQPGSGKSGLTDLAIERFKDTGYVLVDADRMRPYHPQYEGLMRSDDRTAANLTHPDAGPWATRLMHDGVAGRRNLIIDQTSRDPAALERMTKGLHQAGYRVELHVMATPALVSELRIHQRYEGQRARNGYGRFSTKDKHDEAFSGVGATVASTEAGHQVDRLCLYSFDRVLIYDNELVQGRWRDAPKAAQTLQAERTRLLTPPEAAQFTQAYARLLGDLAQPARQAGADELVAMNTRYELAQQLQARSLLANPRAKVHLAGAGGVYVGAVVGETPTHWIQRLSPSMAILHDKGAVKGAAVGHSGTLRYRGGRAEFIGAPERGPERGIGR